MLTRKMNLAMLLSITLVFTFTGAAFGADTSCSELTPLQRFAGLITFGNIMLTGGILGTVGFLTWLLYLVRIPATLYEVGGYAVSIGLVAFAKKLPIGIDPVFIAFAGCIGFAAMLLVSSELHNWKENPTGYCTTLAVSWALVALAYQSELIGFFSVGAFFGALGFFVESYPFMTVIGFEDEDALNRSTGTAFILLSLFTAYKISGTDLPYANLFAYGAYLIGSLVGFTGLLILAYEGYYKKNYIVRQLPIIAAGIAALFFGSVFSIPEIQKIGGTFFGLYLLEKVFDVPSEGRVGYAIKGLAISCLALGIGYLILRFKDFFAPYLLML